MPKSSKSDSKPKKRKSDNDTSEAKKSKKSYVKGTYEGKDGKYVYDGTILTSDEEVRVRDEFTNPIPKKNL